MNKQTFLQVLENRLREVQASDIERTKEYYDEMISDRMDDGMTEEAAVEAMGDLDSIIKEIMINRPMPVLVKESIKNSKEKAEKNGNGTLWMILAICGFPIWCPLLIAAATAVFSLYLSVWAVIISLYATIFSLGVAALCGIVGCVALAVRGTSFPTLLLCIGTSFICGSASVLMWFPMKHLVQLMIKAMKETIFKIKGLFVSGKEGQNEE